MNTTRTITHDSNHTDIETYLQDADGVWMWAVTQCNGGDMYDGYFETPAQIQARFDRINANIEQIKLRNEIIEDVLPRLNLLLDVCGDIDAQNGEFLPIEAGGADVQDAVRWQDEPKKLTAREIALQNGKLRSYASYNNTGKAQPLKAEEVDGEYLGE